MSLSRYIYDTNANIRLERQGEHTVSYAYEHDGLKRFIGYEGMHFSLIRDRSGIFWVSVYVNGAKTQVHYYFSEVKLRNRDGEQIEPNHLKERDEELKRIKEILK
jgi:hypothetical protein